MLYYLLSFVWGAATVAYAVWKRFDTLTIALLLAALGLYYVHFYHTTWEQFTLDPEAHADYITYLAQHHALPPPQTTPATRHPPTYYVLAAAFYDLGEYEQMRMPLQMARHFSMACYMVFLLYSIALLRLFFTAQTRGYYLSLMLLLFWPIGVTMGARITCDLLLYPAQIATLYYLARWLKEEDARHIRSAFIASGIAILAKNTGVLMLVMTGFTLLLAAWQRRYPIRRLARLDIALSFAFAVSCYLITLRHGWVTQEVRNIEPHYPLYWLQTFGAFNLFLFLADTSVGDSRGMFWNMLAHSLLIGEIMQWKADNFLILFNVAWLGVILYILEGMIHSPEMTARNKQIMYMLSLYIFLTIAAMMFMAMQSGNLLYADGRYLYPGVAVIALSFGTVARRHFQAGHVMAYRIGIALAVSFAMLTFILFGIQYCT